MLSALEALKQRTSVESHRSQAAFERSGDPGAGLLCDRSAVVLQHPALALFAVRDAAAKQKLKGHAYNQPKVADAAVTFIVLGDLQGHEKLHLAMSPLVKSGTMDQKSLDGLIGMANQFYSGNVQSSRDEAIRSASFAAMNLMTAAQAKGLVSAPMIGFDPVGVMREFGISERYIPVLLLAVGYPAQGNWPKKPRFGVDQVLSFDKGQVWLED